MILKENNSRGAACCAPTGSAWGLLYVIPMTFNPEIHHRRSIRLPHYDYSRPGAYFVTVCTWNRDPLFGIIIDGEIQLNANGRFVQACWEAIPDHFAYVELDSFTIMPNHVHGILWMAHRSHVGAQHAAPLRRPRNSDASMNVTPGSLGAILRSFKSAATRRINNIDRQTPRIPVWQRNYYERVIRDEAEMCRTREYIQNNPLNWETDEENPERT